MQQHLRAAKRPTHLQPLALAAAMLMAAQAQAQVPAPSFTQSGANSTTGNPSGLPFVGNPASLNFGTDTVLIANGAPGSFAALAGAQLSAGGLSVATGGTGVGTFTAAGTNPGTGLPTRVLIGGSSGGLDIGSWGNATMTVSGGALVDATVNPINCGSGCFNAIGNGAGSTALLEITGAGSEVRALRSFSVGQTSVFTAAGSGFVFGTPGGTTNATVKMLAGGKLSTQQATVGQGPTNADALGTEKGFGTVVVDGVGSQWDVKYNSIDKTAAGITIGNRVGGDGKVTVSNGAKLRVDGTGGPAGQAEFVNLGISGGSGALTVTGGGSSLDMAGYGGAIQAGRSGAGATGSFSVLAGASASAIFLNVGRDGTSGTVLLDGAGTQLRLSGQGPYLQGSVGSAVGAIGWGGSGKVTVSNGALWHVSDGGTNNSATNRGPGITLGASSGVGAGNGSLAISGANSRVEVISTSIAPVGGAADNGNPFVNVGRDSGSTGTVTIAAGGKLLITGNAISTAAAPRTTSLGVGGYSDTTLGGTGSLSISGVGSEARVTGTDAFVTVGRNGTGTLTMSNGGRLETSIVNIGRAASGNGTLTMDASTMVLNGQFSESNGGSGSGIAVGNRSGTGSMTMNNGSVVSITNLGTAGAGLTVGGSTQSPLGSGTLTLNGGSRITITAAPGLASAVIGRDGTGIATLRGGSQIDIGDGTVHVGSLATGTGTLRVESGSKLLAGELNLGGSSDTVAGGLANVTVTGAGSEIAARNDIGRIAVGRFGGNGVLAVNSGGTLTAKNLTVGRNGAGTFNADRATINLSGDPSVNGVFFGPSLLVGVNGGSGTAIINNSTVNVTNNSASGARVNVGGSEPSPQGSGTLALTGGTKVNINAAQGLGEFNVGYNGSGAASIDGAGTEVNVNNGGAVYVARQPGSGGTLVLSNGAVINSGFFGVGVQAPGADAKSIGAPGGTGELTLNDSTINTLRFELGANSLLTGDNGVINVADSVHPVTGLPVKGPVVIAGTIGPGNSPGRLRINCDLTMLAGSKLFLEISDNGIDVDIDQLIIGEDSNFDLFQTQIIFSFLGNTNPEAVDLNLNRFLRAGLTNSDGTMALQTLFGEDEDWNTVVNSKKFAFQSSAYDVTNFEFDARTGSIHGVEASAIPEPASIALVLLALAAMLTLPRRRATRRP